MPDFDWLIARPVAHRGMHDASAGHFENSIGAAREAIAAGLSIECDIQRSADGEAMVFHDFTLERMTAAEGTIGARTAAELGTLSLGGSMDCIETLPSFLTAIAGRVPLICEIKSAFAGDLRLTDRVAEIVETYDGPLALKSFDPAVIAYLRALPRVAARRVPLGIVAEARYDDPEWSDLEPAQKQDLAALTHFSVTRPDFLSYAVDDLPHAATTLFRAGYGRPVMAWTVRTSEQRRRAAQWADQIVFEGFRP